jgi:hypothetical protein
MKPMRIFFISLVASLMACNMSLAGNPSAMSKGYGEYHPVGKPHAPVEMKYQLPTKLKSGKAIEFTLNLMPTRDVESIAVLLRVDDGLKLESASQAGYGATARNTKIDLPVSVVPQREGVFYIHVQVSVQVEGQVQSRSFAIPLNVGDVDAKQHLKSSGVVTEDASGERVISMPAQESVTPARKP